MLTTLFGDRGVHLDSTMQLNVGGNSDFLNMLERERLESKKISKTNAVTSMLDYDIGDKNVHVGPSDYVPWLTDRKWAYIRMEGSSFGDVPLNVELKLEVWDSPNSAGIVIDAVRLAKLALNNGISGALEAPSAYLMKSPPKQIRDDEAREDIERFIVKNAVRPRRRPRRRDPAPARPDLLDRRGGDPRRRRAGRSRRGRCAATSPTPTAASSSRWPRSSMPAGPRWQASHSSTEAVRASLAGSSPALARLGFAVMLWAIWSFVFEGENEPASKLGWSSVLVLLAALVSSTALLLARREALVRLAWGAGALAGSAAIISIAGIWAEPEADAFVKVVAILWILAALAYFLVPILQRMTSAGSQETSSASWQSWTASSSSRRARRTASSRASRGASGSRYAAAAKSATSRASR